MFCVLFVALSCIGTRSVKSEQITRRRIIFCGITGIILFFFNGPLLQMPGPIALRCFLYTVTLTGGYICLLTAGIWIGRLFHNQMLEDPFNNENESFAQEIRLITNEYSVNLPMLFYYKKKWNKG